MELDLFDARQAHHNFAVSPQGHVDALAPEGETPRGAGPRRGHWGFRGGTSAATSTALGQALATSRSRVDPLGGGTFTESGSVTERLLATPCSGHGWHGGVRRRGCRRTPSVLDGAGGRRLVVAEMVLVFPDAVAGHVESGGEG
jgi:hypothetical protein